MQEVGRRIQVWVCEHLGLTWEEAGALRWQYFQKYGTTMGGLIAEHDVDIPDYLFYVHDIPVHTYVKPHPELAAMLDSIPLRKAIYTNATSEYSMRVISSLGVADHFEHVIGIEEVGLRNKPRRDAFELALELVGAEGQHSIMVEDTARNLEPAKALGLKTILVKGDSADYVDVVVDDVLVVAEAVGALLKANSQA